MYGLKRSEIEQIKAKLEKIGIKNPILFGSRAKGSHKRGSDVDLAVIGDEKRANYVLNEETNMPYFFDVVNIKKIKNRNLLEHIQRVGKIL